MAKLLLKFLNQSVALGCVWLLTLGPAVAKGLSRKAAKPDVSSAEEEQPELRTATPSVRTGIDPVSGVLNVVAQGATVIDGLSGKAIFEKNANQVFYPASATKILTALIVIESGNLDQEVTIELPDTKVEPSSLDMKPGDKFTRRQMLYGLLLKSANDVAQALARDNAGSIAAFAEKMNQRALALGATGSHFMNPHGLHNKEHYTTPHDLALIARAAMSQPFLHQVVGTVTHPWIGSNGLVELHNHNRLLGMFPDCNGIKTGYTVPAQQVLVSSALRNGREVIAVVMHTDKPGIWEDSKALLNFGFEHLSAMTAGNSF